MQPFDENHDINDVCKCGHFYYRHYDSYDDNAPVGCKYCPCDEFVSLGVDTGRSLDRMYSGLCCLCDNQATGSSPTCEDHQWNYLGQYGRPEHTGWVYPEDEVVSLRAACDDLVQEVERLKAAVRKHRDQRGDDACHLDNDLLYYEVLGEGADPYVGALPNPECMLESCRRYVHQRRHPEIQSTSPGDMTIAQLTQALWEDRCQ